MSKKRTFVAALIGLLLPAFLHAQKPQGAGGESEAEREGKKLFRQRCSICHVRVAPGERTYGPVLSGEVVAGKETAVRETIVKGTARMPGFQYALLPKQVDQIIAYLETVRKKTPSSKRNQAA